MYLYWFFTSTEQMHSNNKIINIYSDSVIKFNPIIMKIVGLVANHQWTALLIHSYVAMDVCMCLQ
jgi:hypothetical protein